MGSQPDAVDAALRRHEAGGAAAGQRRKRKTMASTALVGVAVMAVVALPLRRADVQRHLDAWISPRITSARSTSLHRAAYRNPPTIESETEAPPRGSRLSDALKDRDSLEKGAPATGHQTWTDYTRYALGIEDHGPGAEGQPGAAQAREGKGEGRSMKQLVERSRALGIDFGPKFTGMALSLGGVNTIPMGTLQTGEDWNALALKIAQMASTRRARDIVVGQPLEKDGTEGKISALVRHFSQILADATLLVVGTNCSVYLWDERFSTTYAAMRLVTRPRFDSGAFKSWLDGQRGLSFSAKALLDAEAARAILEHFLEKDPSTEVINKDMSERVSPSRAACRAYLEWKKKPLIQAARPKEPAGPGKEGWEWDDAHPWDEEISPEDYMAQAENFSHYMEGSDNFGDRTAEWEVRSKRRAEDKQIDAERRYKQDMSSVRDKFKSAGIGVEDEHISIADRRYQSKD